jgi:predicted DNA-binding transcriptional regulator AlpA
VRVLLEADDLKRLLHEEQEPMRKELAQIRAEIGRLRPEKAPQGDKAGHIDIVKLTAKLGKDRSTISRWCRAGSFPAPHYCGQLRCWLRSEVDEWEAARRAAPHSPRLIP